MNQKRWIDDDKWNDLLDTLEEDLFEVAESFCEDSKINVGKMRAALQEEDYAVLNRLAHSMKSSSGIFGARGLMEMCFRVERESLRGAPDLLDQINEIDGVLDWVILELTERLDEYRKGNSAND